MEAELHLKLNSKFKPIVKDIDFSELCITSKAIISFDDNTEIIANTRKATGKKCEVCWKIRLDPCERHPKCQIT